MLDIHVLREHSARVAQNLRDRHARVFEDLAPASAHEPADPDWAAQTVARLLELDGAYLALLRRQDELRQAQNQTSAAMKAVASLPKDQQAAERTRLVEHGRQLRGDERSLVDQTDAALRARDDAWSRVPNLTHPDTPRGRTDDDHREIDRVGAPRDFAAEGFTPRDHLAIAEALDLVDFDAGARVAGQKFYYLKHEAVLLDLALQHFALGVAARHGFTLHTTPDLAREEILRGLGFQPRGESTQVYTIENSDLCLVGTAEITLGGMYADAILDEEKLPLLVAGLSHCFRTEAGSAGQESRGLYRVHQFTKVELFAFTTPEQSEAMHDRLRAIEEEIFSALKIPYRVLDIASGDLGGPAYRKFDLEAWMPGRGAYGEITSTSNCTDYQARRLRIRYRPQGEPKAKPRHVHMLNGTAVATSRALVAILENYQQQDGSVRVPEVLQPLVGVPVIAPRRGA